MRSSLPLWALKKRRMGYGVLLWLVVWSLEASVAFSDLRALCVHMDLALLNAVMLGNRCGHPGQQVRDKVGL